MLVRSGTVATRGATIAFAVRGATAGIPVLLIAPGGMRSSIGMWRAQPWDAWSRLGDEDFTVVAMDQRNAPVYRSVSVSLSQSLTHAAAHTTRLFRLRI